MIRGLGFSRRNVADRSEQPLLVEPVYPVECIQFYFCAVPSVLTSDDFGLVQAVDGFRQRVVVGAANRTGTSSSTTLAI